MIEFKNSLIFSLSIILLQYISHQSYTLNTSLIKLFIIYEIFLDDHILFHVKYQLIHNPIIINHMEPINYKLGISIYFHLVFH